LCIIPSQFLKNKCLLSLFDLCLINTAIDKEYFVKYLFLFPLTAQYFH
jgi:hypothetical protein